MFEQVSDGTDIALYADDTKIWRKIVGWSDHIILQQDIDSLQNWAVENKMKFHPDKCKVISISNRASEHHVTQMWSMLPFQSFEYNLNEVILNFTEDEKDLGVVVASDLGWDENVHALYQKASSRLGLMKRTLHFIKDSKQKRTFYLALVRSIFEHCSVVWRPTTITTSDKVECIQRRAVKWILGEYDHHYNDIEYLSRLRDLDLLPMESKFDYTDLVMFHNIYYERSVVKLPSYITPITNNDRGRLRMNIRQPDRLNQSETSVLSSLSQRRMNRLDEFSLKSTVEAKARPFKSSFFFRTHLKWNDLPSDLKGEAVSSVFQSKLKKHLCRHNIARPRLS